MPEYLDPFGDGSPGPYVQLRLTWDGAQREILGLLDSGADQTQIPAVTADALKLVQTDVMSIASAHGDEKEKPIYVVNVEFNGLRFDAVEVVADDFPIALIGRDLMNELNTELLGPSRRFTIVRP